jgi:NTP-dependent ternary system trypsin peptidase co-occuring protein
MICELEVSVPHTPSHLLRVSVATCILLLICRQAAALQTPNDQGMLIDELLAEIQTALAKVQKDLVFQKIPPLKSVTLDLVVEANTEIRSGINLYIVTFGTKVERGRSQEVEITLKPPSPSAPLKAGKGPSVTDELVGAIESAAKGVQAARKNSDVPLETSGLKFVLYFVVKGTASAGFKIEIAPITADFSGDVSNSATQKITVLYENPDKTGK